MESVEQTGRTVEEAVNAALKVLGVSREEIEVEVLSQESRGILGSILGYSSAKVRVTKRPAPEPVERVPHPAETERQPVRPAAEPERRPVRPAEAEGAERSELAVQAAEIADEILKLMGINAQAVITEDSPEEVALDIHSEEDLGLLIGRHGQTLAALQLLVAMIANRHAPEEERRRVIIDAEGYRERRDRSLEAMARSAAQQAKRSGRPVTISSLTPRERRIVHLALADDPTVTTRSEGEDPNRSIIVTARRERYRP
jgi:spoIIIJ-associated protein